MLGGSYEPLSGDVAVGSGLDATSSPAQRLRRYRAPRATPSSVKPSRIPPMTLHAWLRYDAFRRLLPEGIQSFLEIGAGKGAVGSMLARRFRYVGLEPDAESFVAALNQVGHLGTVVQTPEEAFDGDSFDAACAFEVLEHIEDDRAALVRWQRHVKPGGWLFVSVPAGRHRFGPTDRKAGHFRRYDRADLTRVLREAGLKDSAILAYGFPIGYALEAGRNLVACRLHHATSLEERTAESGRWLQAPEWASIPLRTAAVPFELLQRPFGSTALGTGLVARAHIPG
jgi:SAM-dependent methyltransferase